jgi:tetratricopeptide (TPR) repeat protein
VTRILPLAVVLALLAPAPALADDASPTPEQIEAAKKAFGEGKKLHEQGKHTEAIEKFKESYRLSKNPLLLYNIGFTLDEAKDVDMALFYYRKFLKDAPPQADKRAFVTERVTLLEQQKPSPEPEPVKPAPKPEGSKPSAAIKPPGTYGTNDFQHQVVETAPPSKPLDVTAFVPEDSGFVVTLFFRTAGEGRYASKVMKWRYKELVGRIPAPKMIGSAIHYYIEVKDADGAVVTRSGKSTSPNLVNLEAGTPARFYPDLTDEPEAAPSPAEQRKRDEADDPLSGGKKVAEATPEAQPEGPPPPTGSGFGDVGSRKFFYSKWVSTGFAGALIGSSIMFYLQAGRYSSRIEKDFRECGVPPCREFDDYARGVLATGQRYDLLS